MFIVAKVVGFVGPVSRVPAWRLDDFHLKHVLPDFTWKEPAYLVTRYNHKIDHVGRLVSRDEVKARGIYFSQAGMRERRLQ